MADIAKSGTPELSSPIPPPNNQTTGLVAGEALGAWDACYIKASDGKVYKSTGAAATAAAEVHGYTPIAQSSGDKGVTLYHGNVNIAYGSGMTPGGQVFLSEVTAGALADTVGGTAGTRKLGFIVDATRIRLYAVGGR